MIGHWYRLLLCGGAIAYRSKLQPTVSTSSTEAEFIAAMAAAKTAKYLRVVLSDLGFPQLSPTTLYEDNQSAILMVNASLLTSRSRHIAIQHFAIQEWKEHGDILLEQSPASSTLPMRLPRLSVAFFTADTSAGPWDTTASSCRSTFNTFHRIVFHCPPLMRTMGECVNAWKL